jgi:hypothetical protein
MTGGGATMTEPRAYTNSNRELFREDTGDPAGSYYENSIHVAEGGRIGMNVAGTVYVKSIAEWHSLAGGVIYGPEGNRSYPKGAIPNGPWRVGTKCPKNLYVEDGSGPDGRGQDVGRMDTPELGALVVEAVNRHLNPPDLRRWGSAADTVAEHETEAEARSHEANTATVHRWPTGPWLTDEEKVWLGDDSFSELHSKLFRLENELRTVKREAAAEIANRDAQIGRWQARDMAARNAAGDVKTETSASREWRARLSRDPNPHDGDLRPWRTCPHCNGSGRSYFMVDGGYTCTSCSGSGFINRAGYWAAPPPTGKSA